MQRLEVSRAVRRVYTPLSAKGVIAAFRNTAEAHKNRSKIIPLLSFGQVWSDWDQVNCTIHFLRYAIWSGFRILITLIASANTSTKERSARGRSKYCSIELKPHPQALNSRWSISTGIWLHTLLEVRRLHYLYHTSCLEHPIPWSLHILLNNK